MCDNLICRTHKRHKKQSNKHQFLAYNFIVKAIRKIVAKIRKKIIKCVVFFTKLFYKNIVDISVYIAYYRGSF